MESFIKGVFTTRIVLFIGYSFSDVDLKILLHTVRVILQEDFQQAYILSVDDDSHESQRQYLKNKGINVLHFNDGEYQMHSMAQRDDLSPKGNRLLQFLEFITTFDGFGYSIASTVLLTQIEQTLDRFYGCRSMHSEFLSNLYPFNITKQHIFHFHDYILGRNNKLNNQIIHYYWHFVRPPF